MNVTLKDDAAMIYTLADWQQEAANGDTERGYREWVEAKVEGAAHDRYAALLAAIKAGVADQCVMDRVHERVANCVRYSRTENPFFFDLTAESVAREVVATKPAA